ncbi:MAG: hypothetical protein WC223_08980 [Bacteroidales bacterium]|jgi:hypothetical protein
MKVNKNNIPFFVLIIMIIGFFISCQSDKGKLIDNPATLKQYCNNSDNGLIKKKDIENISIIVKYRPTDFMVANELRNKKVTNKVVDSLRKIYSTSYYFILEIMYNTKNSAIEGPLYGNSISYQEYAKKVSELSFDFQNKVYLVSGKDTVKPVLHSFERGYELENKETILLCFQGDIKNDSVKFCYYDDLFGTGMNQFQFVLDKEKLPKLNNIN